MHLNRIFRPSTFSHSLTSISGIQVVSVCLKTWNLGITLSLLIQTKWHLISEPTFFKKEFEVIHLCITYRSECEFILRIRIHLSNCTLQILDNPSSGTSFITNGSIAVKGTNIEDGMLGSNHRPNTYCL